jgi:DnaK suppressor protein
MTLDMKQVQARLEAKLAELQGRYSGQVVSSSRTIQSNAYGGVGRNGKRTAEMQQVQVTSMSQQELLADVNEAIKRVDQGTYGRCAICGKPIPETLLAAFPWTIRDELCEMDWDLEHLSEDEILVGRD